jgi:hypothetical protein
VTAKYEQAVSELREYNGTGTDELQSFDLNEVFLNEEK